jgi:hypothetical protein
MFRLPLTAACLATIAAAQSAPADQVELSNGSRLDAQVANEPAESRSHVALESEYGKLVLDRDRVPRVVTETPAEADYRRRSPSVSDTVEAQFALANWCRDNGVADGMRRHLGRVLELDPEHAEARMLLGYQQVDGRWMTRDDVLAARGLVRWKGEYRTPQEVALLEMEAKAEAAALAWRTQLAEWRKNLDGADRDAARSAEESLIALSDPAAVPELFKLLADEQAPAVRRLYMKSLGSLATPDSLGALAQHAICDNDPEVRAIAVEQLIATGRAGVAAWKRPRRSSPSSTPSSLRTNAKSATPPAATPTPSASTPRPAAAPSASAVADRRSKRKTRVTRKSSTRSSTSPARTSNTTKRNGAPGSPANKSPITSTSAATFKIATIIHDL